MDDRLDDICPRPESLLSQPTSPLVAPISPATVYRCDSPDQADALLSGAESGYVYRRGRQPNAELLAQKCRELHSVDRAEIASSGMGAMALALLSQLKTGDHVVLSNQLYAGNATLFLHEAARLGIAATEVDTSYLTATAAAIIAQTRMLVVETITNPMLRVSNLTALAEIAHAHDVLLLVDNTFASPIVCQPKRFGADLIHESLTKIMSGHSDVMLGMLCGPASLWERVADAATHWGFCPSPWDCWLASRIGTLHLRVERANDNALAAAEFLASRNDVQSVAYPGLPEHPDHQLARQQFGDRFGAMVTFTLPGGRPAATRFIAAAKHIPFCPSLGDLSTTLSHPESTSHRGLTPSQRAALGIDGGTIRLSLGVESADFVREALAEGLAGN